MTLMMNELGEFYRPEDFEPPRNPFAKYAKMPASRFDDEPVRARAKPSKVYNKKCDICHEPFVTGHKDQKYCSDECRKEAKRRSNAKRRKGAIAASSLSVALALIFPLAACADEPLEVMDLPLHHAIAGGSMSHGMATIVEPQAPGAVEEPDRDFAAEHPDVDFAAGNVESGYQPADGYYGYVAEYDPMYNTDGPTREMPGWHDGYLETYFNASAHYRAGEWTVDSEGFYRDGDYYVVGVDIADTNPNTGEPYRIGDVVETGKGSAVVMDYGSGARVHDFAVAWQ